MKLIPSLSGFGKIRIVDRKSTKLLHFVSVMASSFSKRLKYLIDTVHDGNVKEAARQSGVPQPTLHALYRGVAERPRRKTLERLVSFYGVSEEWLRGEKGRTRNPEWVLPMGWPTGPPARGPGRVEKLPFETGWVERLPLDDRALYHWRRFQGICYRAWQRDRGRGDQIPEWRAVWASLRAQVLGARERDYLRPGQGRQSPRLERSDYAQLVPARTRHLEALWKPWFADKMKLDYRRLIRDSKRYWRGQYREPNL